MFCYLQLQQLTVIKCRCDFNSGKELLFIILDVFYKVVPCQCKQNFNRKSRIKSINIVKHAKRNQWTLLTSNGTMNARDQSLYLQKKSCRYMYEEFTMTKHTDTMYIDRNHIDSLFYLCFRSTAVQV